jgi:predicted Zn-ribbon and HTH transcriptional regulator
MKTPKQVFDKKYEIYRNLENKPPIPLEARNMIFASMQEFADEYHEELKKASEVLKQAEPALGISSVSNNEACVVAVCPKCGSEHTGYDVFFKSSKCYECQNMWATDC